MIYLICKGEYSDWDVLGYFTDEDAAYEYCWRYNVSKERYFDDCYVIGLDEITAQGSPVKPLYSYTFEVNRGENGMYLCNIDDGFDGLAKTSESIGVCFFRNYSTWVSALSLRVITPTRDPEKARKTATDSLAKITYAECVEKGRTVDEFLNSLKGGERYYI